MGRSAERRWFRVQAIGEVRRPDGAAVAAGDYYEPWAETVLEIEPRWSAGLEGIEGYSHLVVLFYLDRAPRRRTAGRPRPAEGDPALPPVGFFATRTPKRPNPLGIACPRLLRREGSRLIVEGIDAWDGTPILDLKGYSPRDELRSDAAPPPWLRELWTRHDQDQQRRRAGARGPDAPPDFPLTNQD